MQVIISCLQFGQIECVKWLVKNTCIREKLGRRDGERSLLHAAAKYGKVRLIYATLTNLNIMTSDCTKLISEQNKHMT